ncbi:monovalent cation/H(+) antiporter subunit G [Nitratireductor sp. XY-223]|uniref:monovalent cation/H(+) antiporter subunit G n=1 Tax=Nitratireductor sp. XY-223 TaxID=2561926 RepID=UPI0010A998D0|nr:monovalent cation/H(+) antiporter subunit G [Nitratireductor sp. XY-223]
MSSFVAILIALMIVIGSGFTLVAALGLLRFPDVYTRMHAASKAGTLGSGVVLIALGIEAGDTGTLTRALAGVCFFLLTAPISAHLLAKASYAVGYPLSDQSVVDEMPKSGDGANSESR